MHWCVVLAAGGSRRLGRPKQFVQHRGSSLLRATVVRALQTRAAGVVVVTGAHAARAAADLRGLHVAIVRNRRWRDGLASSLRAGMQRVPAFAPSVVVTTVDQWQVSTTDLERLLRFRAPVAAAYGGVTGIPAVLPRAWRDRIRALRGDSGARALFARERPRTVAMPAAAADLDTREDLTHVRMRGMRRSNAAVGVRHGTR